MKFPDWFTKWFEQRYETDHYIIERLWIIDVIPMKSLGKFLDRLTEALSDEYPPPKEKVTIKVGFREGRHMGEDGTKFEIPNCLFELFSAYTIYAILIRAGEASPLIYPTDRIRELKTKFQSWLRDNGLFWYEFIVFKTHYGFFPWLKEKIVALFTGKRDN